MGIESKSVTRGCKNAIMGIDSKDVTMGSEM